MFESGISQTPLRTMRCTSGCAALVRAFTNPLSRPIPKRKTPRMGRFVLLNIPSKSFMILNLLFAAISCWQSIRVRCQEFLRLHLTPILPLLTKPFASIVPTPSLPEMRIQISPLLMGWSRAIWQIAYRCQSADEGGLVCSPMYTTSPTARVLPGIRPY